MIYNNYIIQLICYYAISTLHVRYLGPEPNEPRPGNLSDSNCGPILDPLLN